MSVSINPKPTSYSTSLLVCAIARIAKTCIQNGVSFTPLVFLCSKQRASISLRPIPRPRTISCDCTPQRATMLVGVPSHPLSQQRSATNVKRGCCMSHKLHRPVHAPSEPYLIRCNQSCVEMIDHRPGLTMYISFTYSFLSFERYW